MPDLRRAVLVPGHHRALSGGMSSSGNRTAAVSHEQSRLAVVGSYPTTQRTELRYQAWGVVSGDLWDLLSLGEARDELCIHGHDHATRRSTAVEGVRAGQPLWSPRSSRLVHGSAPLDSYGQPPSVRCDERHGRYRSMLRQSEGAYLFSTPGCEDTRGPGAGMHAYVSALT